MPHTAPGTQNQEIQRITARQSKKLSGISGPSGTQMSYLLSPLFTPSLAHLFSCRSGQSKRVRQEEQVLFPVFAGIPPAYPPPVGLCPGPSPGLAPVCFCPPPGCLRAMHPGSISRTVCRICDQAFGRNTRVLLKTSQPGGKSNPFPLLGPGRSSGAGDLRVQESGQ